MADHNRQRAIVLLELCHEEEINHLKLLLIRESQAPRFAKLTEEIPQIQNEFLAARAIHDDLKRIREKMVVILRAYIESRDD